MRTEAGDATQTKIPRGACPLCGVARAVPIWRRNTARIDRCPGCGVLFVAERPAESETARLYDEGILFGGRPEFSANPDAGIPGWKRREHCDLLDRMARLGVRQGRLLDVGCYAGTFLRQARERAFDVMGVEPSGDACGYIREVLRIPVVHGTLASAVFPGGSFSAVCLLDVIEHVPDPVEELCEVHRILQPGGVLVITTPNAAGLPQRVLKTKRLIFRQDWCPIDDVPWHLWGFTRDSLRLCVEKAGFAVREILALVPSPRSTNENAGSNGWKKSLLRIVSDVSEAMGMSDRMALLAGKPAL